MTIGLRASAGWSFHRSRAVPAEDSCAHHRMHGVVEVLDEQLPVALVQVAQRAADHLETAARRAVRQIVDRGDRESPKYSSKLGPAAAAGRNESPMHARRRARRTRPCAADDSSRPLPA